MTLSFTQTINGKPNFFIEKIWQAFLQNDLSSLPNFGYYAGNYNYSFGKFWDGFVVDGKPDEKPKLHTIREDKSNRWRAGMNIHPVVNNRTPNRFQFAPIIPCKSVQRIDIKDVTGTRIMGSDLNYGYLLKHTVRDVDFYLAYEVYVDGKRLMADTIVELAINDGFDTIDDFFKYFADGIVNGKLIHWTDKTY